MAHQVFVGIAHHPADALQTGDLFRGALGVAARNQNPALGIASMDAPHKLAHFRVGRRGDRAGVQDRDLALFKICRFLKSGLKQLLLQRGAIRLAGAATEIEKLECRHGENTIVTEMGYRPPPGKVTLERRPETVGGKVTGDKQDSGTRSRKAVGSEKSGIQNA